MTAVAESSPLAQDPTASPTLSIIIPTLDEEHSIAALLGDLDGLGIDHEVIVVDGGSIDRTRAVAQQRGAKVIMTRPGRGHQLAAGATISRGRLLCFLHADVRLPGRTQQLLAEEVAAMKSGAAVFTLTINAEGRRFRVIERMANWRTRVLGLPYGDQGLLVARADYEAVGGYQDIRLMEDVAIVRALRRHSVVRLLDETLLVSARRWRRDGVWPRTLGNWSLILLYMMGFSPNFLARFYPAREPTARRTNR